jgi:hypothetical protein
MHNSIRKLLIFAAVDGIVLQPAPSKNHKPATEQAIKIAYKGNGIGPLLKDKIQEETAHQALEAHGIVGKPFLLRTANEILTSLVPNRSTEGGIFVLYNIHIPKRTGCSYSRQASILNK